MATRVRFNKIVDRLNCVLDEYEKTLENYGETQHKIQRIFSNFNISEGGIVYEDMY